MESRKAPELKPQLPPPCLDTQTLINKYRTEACDQPGQGRINPQEPGAEEPGQDWTGHAHGPLPETRP